MKALADFYYHEPLTVEETIEILKTYNAENNYAKIFAGGTDILDLMKKRYRFPQPNHLVNITKIPNLNKIKISDDGLNIGPTVTLSQLIEESPIQMLIDSAKRIATPQIRNAGSVGGNICQDVRCWYYRWPEWYCSRKGGSTCFAPTGRNVFHAITKSGACCAVIPSDLAPCLTALNAILKIDGFNSREVAIKDFYDPQKFPEGNILERNELITNIIIPKIPSKGVFLKNSIRKALDFSIVSIAAARFDDGKINIAIGGVGPIIPNGELSEIDVILKNLADKKYLSENRYKFSITKHLLDEALGMLHNLLSQ